MAPDLSIHNGQYVIEHGREPAFYAPCGDRVRIHKYVWLYTYGDNIKLLNHLHHHELSPLAEAELDRQTCRILRMALPLHDVRVVAASQHEVVHHAACLGVLGPLDV